MHDWYTIKRKDIKKKGGKILFKYYASLQEALQSVYPEYPWESTRFNEWNKVPRGHWDDESTLKAALDNAAKKIGIKEVKLLPFEC